MIIHGARYFEAIKSEIKSSKRNSIVVAFWGTDAQKALGLRHPDRTMIICNLTMGGTNPMVIKKLVEENYKVLHSSRLHGKVFRFENSAIVGSANASANGLSFEGNELDGWQEIGILTRDPSELAAIDNWIKLIENESRVVNCDGDEFKSALNKWERARNRRPSQASRNNRLNLLEALASHLDEFRERPIYLACFTEGLSRNGENEAKRIKGETQYGSKFSVYEGWPKMPRDATLIEFSWTNGKLAPDFGGFWQTNSNWRDSKRDNSSYQIVMRVAQFETHTAMGLLSEKRLGSMANWHKVLERIKQNNSHKWKKDKGCCIRIANIAIPRLS